MRVAAVHANYRVSGGEERSFAQDVVLLRAIGAEVDVHTSENADFGGANMLRGQFLNNQSFVREVTSSLERADVLLVNNLWPSASPAVIDVALSRGIPVIQAVRNYRLVCAAATLIRNGQPCTDCLQANSRLPGIRHRCYQKSLSGSVAVTAAASKNARILRRSAVPWVLTATSSSVRKRLIDGGFPPDRVLVRPNFLLDPPEAQQGARKGAIYVGRLSAEKGVRLLADVWRANPDLPELTFVGEGPDESEIRAILARDPRIIFRGVVPYREALMSMSRASVCVVPSQWDEPFGRTAMEALAMGTPVIASRLGALPDVVGESGLCLDPGDKQAWAQAVRDVTATKARSDRVHLAARNRFDQLFSRAAAEANMRTALIKVGM